MRTSTHPRFQAAMADSQAFSPQRVLLVGGDGIPIEHFLTHPIDHWI